MISRYAIGAVLLALGACGRTADAPPARATASPAGETVADSPPGGVAPAVVFLGTSLTAGLGLDPALAYPALVQAKIDSAGLHYRVVNAGVSGETSAGALRRIDWLLRDPPAVLVIETGANDALRGQNPDSVRANIQAIIDRARAITPPPSIVLVGMEALPNYGPAYVRRFREIYPELAKQNRIPFIPFLLAGVAGIDSLNQPDGLHPTAAGQRIVAQTVWKALEPVLRNGRG
ncbi:MAG TPA: arylesterase [Gemmatimonadales bacterium]